MAAFSCAVCGSGLGSTLSVGGSLMPRPLLRGLGTTLYGWEEDPCSKYTVPADLTCQDLADNR